MIDHAVLEGIRRAAVVEHREDAFRAIIQMVSGIAVTVVTLGFLFCATWIFGGFFADLIGLRRTSFSLAVMALFGVVSIVSAWRSVDPLKGVKPMSDIEMLMLEISLLTPRLGYFSPRHATAGAAWVLIGGPANVFDGVRSWRERLRANEVLLRSSADLLDRCRANVPVRQLGPAASAAVLLRRLGFAKVVGRGPTAELALTERGRTLAADQAARPPRLP